MLRKRKWRESHLPGPGQPLTDRPTERLRLGEETVPVSSPAGVGGRCLSEPPLKSPLPCLLVTRPGSERGAGPGETVPGRKAKRPRGAAAHVRAGAGAAAPAAVPGAAAPEQQPRPPGLQRPDRAAEGDPVGRGEVGRGSGGRGRASGPRGGRRRPRQRGQTWQRGRSCFHVSSVSGRLVFQGRFPWRRKWQPTPVFLPGKARGWRSLAGYSPWGPKESDTAERLHFSTFKHVYCDVSCQRLHLPRYPSVKMVPS